MIAGYSVTPLWKKLGFKPGMKVSVLGGPSHYDELLEGRHEGIEFVKAVKGTDAIHLFMVETKEVAKIAKLANHLPPATMLWVSWPKLTSRLSKGLREDDIRNAAIACGLVDIKVCAVDQDWSGLKLVRRKA
jgi:hypothetical protein